MILFCKEYSIQPAKVIEIILLVNTAIVSGGVSEVHVIIYNPIVANRYFMISCIGFLECFQFDTSNLWNRSFWLHNNELLQHIQSQML